ncbi:hypothetical protein BS50DRAFT_665846 [Corynespora cassiicola Philippines]|uniref:Uncharacterized protein n=1 Tax=Corynespora cassiicola Philippines TaxID=1448308 RepID=A0A2T2NS13_CORCC|nr:hypothetical protein BS50DRAFT_665846 [Corynespora cassiicola Philippines]
MVLNHKDRGRTLQSSGSTQPRASEASSNLRRVENTQRPTSQKSSPYRYFSPRFVAPTQGSTESFRSAPVARAGRSQHAENSPSVSLGASIPPESVEHCKPISTIKDSHPVVMHSDMALNHNKLRRSRPESEKSDAKHRAEKNPKVQPPVISATQGAIGNTIPLTRFHSSHTSSMVKPAFGSPQPEVNRDMVSSKMKASAGKMHARAAQPSSSSSTSELIFLMPSPSTNSATDNVSSSKVLSTAQRAHIRCCEGTEPQYCDQLIKSAESEQVKQEEKASQGKLSTEENPGSCKEHPVSWAIDVQHELNAISQGSHISETHMTKLEDKGKIMQAYCQDEKDEIDQLGMLHSTLHDNMYEDKAVTSQVGASSIDLSKKDEGSNDDYVFIQHPVEGEVAENGRQNRWFCWK